MEADLDLADRLQTTGQELSGDDLIQEHYASEKAAVPSKAVVHRPYNNALYASSVDDFRSKSHVDPVLHRPITPGQLRQSVVTHTVDSLVNSLAISDIFHSPSNGSEKSNNHLNRFPASTSIPSKKLVSASIAATTTTTTAAKVKPSKTLLSISRPRSSTHRLSSVNSSKQITPVLAFGSNDDDDADRAVPVLSTHKGTPPMKFSFSEPPRSNSSASIRSSSSSSTLDSMHGSIHHSKTRRS